MTATILAILYPLGATSSHSLRGSTFELASRDHYRTRFYDAFVGIPNVSEIFQGGFGYTLLEWLWLQKSCYGHHVRYDEQRK